MPLLLETGYVLLQEESSDLVLESETDPYLTTPAERTTVIAAETRLFPVAAETRTLEVKQ